MPEFLRVTDDVKPRREYTIVAESFIDGAHIVLDKPATAADGSVLPPKYTPDALGEAPADVPPTEVPGYEDRNVEDLKAEIDVRNTSRPEDEQISKSGNKKALVEALAADDAKVGEAPPTTESLSS